MMSIPSGSGTWRTTWLILLSMYVGGMLFFGSWRQAISHGGDAWGYYVYLPAALIYHDLGDLQGVLRVRQQMHPGSVWEDNGILRAGEAPAYGDRNVIKYTYGVALLHLPAFCLAHVMASVSETWPASGYAPVYSLAMFLSTIGYLMLGLWCVARVMRRYFTESAVLVTVLIIGLGTNLYYFGVLNNMMAHPVLFFLWAALVLKSDNYWRNPTLGGFAWCGFLVGLITVIRPVEVISVAIPVFYGLQAPGGVFGRLRELLTKRYTHVIAAVMAGCLAVLPQLIYWKCLTGQWFYDSYPGEHFDFLHPHVWSGLTSFLNGWLPYTPVMVFALIGFGFLWRRFRYMTILLLILLAVHIYLTYAWWNWYYINGFGSRPMVDIYAILAFPLAACVQDVLKMKWRWIVFVLWSGCIALNVFQMYQVKLGVLTSAVANRAYYFQAFGRTQWTQRISVALDLENYQFEDISADTLLFFSDFESDSLNSSQYSSEQAFSGSRSYLVGQTKAEDLDMWNLTLSDAQIQEYRGSGYLLFECQVYVERQISDLYKYDALCIRFLRSGEEYRRRYLRFNNKPGDPGQNSMWWGIPGTWYPLKACLRLPGRMEPGDQIMIQPNHGTEDSRVLIDDLRISLASRK